MNTETAAAEVEVVKTGGVEMPQHGHAGVLRQISSEWTKLRSLRSTWICLLIIVVAGIGLSVLLTSVEASHWASLGSADRARFDPVAFSQVGIALSEFVVGVLAALVVCGEYSSGTISSTLTAVPRRATVLAAKALVIGSLILVLSEIVGFISFFLCRAVLLGHGAVSNAHSSIIGQALSMHPPVSSLSDPGVLLAVALGGVFLTLLALCVIGLGFIVRSTAGTIALFVGVLLVLPIITSLLPSSITGSVKAYLPSALGTTMTSTIHTSTFSGTLLSPWAATAWMALYAAVLLVASWVRLVRSDA